jgi:hypothetical protein
MSDSEAARYERAYERVKQLRSFYTHLISFFAANTVLFIVDVVTGDGWWFYWVSIGWGFGLLIHALSVFVGGLFRGGWEERKIREMMEREKASSKTSEPGQ